MANKKENMASTSIRLPVDERRWLRLLARKMSVGKRVKVGVGDLLRDAYKVLYKDQFDELKKQRR